MMNRIARLILSLLLVAYAPMATWAQPVQQSGTVTPNHATRWIAPGVTADAGSAAGAATVTGNYLNTLGITATGLPFCINDALTASPGGYHSLCFGANVNGQGLLSFQANGGAAATQFSVNINGATYPLAFPFVNGLPEVINNAGLKALAVGYGAVVYRDGFYAYGDGGGAFYSFSSTQCSLNGGAGDNGSQVAPNLGTGCWLLGNSSPFNLKWWGATGNGTTDDTVAAQNWMTFVAANGSDGYAPSGTYAISNVLTQTVTGFAEKIRGAGRNVTNFLFTAATDGIRIALARNGTTGQWGAAALSDLTITRAITSPAQANIGLSFIADPTATAIYYGPSGLSDVWVRGPTQASGWNTGVLLENVNQFDIRSIQIQGPNATGAGSDIGLSLIGGGAAHLYASLNMTNSIIQGFSTGLNSAGYVQGILVVNSSIIGDWWGINFQGVDGGTVYQTSGTTGAGPTIQVSPATAALLTTSMVVNGANIAPQSRITAINTGTGVISLTPNTTGTVSSGENITVQAYYASEALQVMNSSFAAAYRDILTAWTGQDSVIGNSLIRFTTASSDWGAVDFEECDFDTIIGNTIITGTLSGRANGIIVSSLGYQGTTSQTIIGNVVNGVSGAGVFLGGVSDNLTGGTVVNATVMGNSLQTVSAGVVTAQENRNAIFNNQEFGNIPDVSTSSTAPGTMYFNLPVVQLGGHLAVNQPAVSPVTVSTCGAGPTMGNGSSDMGGTITIGSGTVTTCGIIFGSGYVSPPNCVGMLSTGLVTYMAGRATTYFQFGFSGNAAGDTLNYWCSAPSGG